MNHFYYLIENYNKSSKTCESPFKGFSETSLGNSKRKARGEKPPRANLSPITLHTANLAYRHVVRIRHRIPQTDAFAFVLVNASVGETRVLIALEVQHRHIHQRVVEEAQGNE